MVAKTVRCHHRESWCVSDTALRLIFPGIWTESKQREMTRALPQGRIADTFDPTAYSRARLASSDPDVS